MGEGKHVMEEGYQTMGGELGMGEGKDTTSDYVKKKCPMCQGRGYYEEIGQPQICKPLDSSGGHKGILPDITQQCLQQQPYQLEQLFKAKATGDSKTIGRLSDTAVPITIIRPNTRFPSVHIPNTTARKSANQVKSSPNSVNIGNFPQLVNLLPAPSKIDKNPEDMARLAAIKLNRDEWETKKAGLEDCLDLAHSYPDELDPYMSLVYRTMSSLLNNCRPPVTLFTCQAAREFFAKMRSICRPEYDELVFNLLNRTADNNRYIRLNANDALDKMVIYIPTVHAVRPLVEKGPFHNNPLVRTATARLLTCIVVLKTPNAILTHPTLRETCKRILETAAILLADHNLDTRAAAKKLFKQFLNEDEFESIYYAEVDETLRKRIDRPFTELRYKKHSQA